jgi:hypothetical protein
MIRQDQCTGARMHTVKSPQHVPPLDATVIEAGDNGIVFDATRPFVVFDRHMLAADLVQHDPMKRSAHDGDSVSRSGLVPTPRAEELAPLLREATDRLSLAIDRRGFIATETTRTFTIALSDNYQACEAPRIARAFAARMPRATLRVVSTRLPGCQ